jgi:predicted AlkP superfamily phosphohydrolase/phosphomutase
MFFSALDHSRRGVVACVFDTPDRIQHMFFRQLGDDGGQVIEDLYRRMDRLVEKTLAYVDSETVLVVLSDHGFAAFRRGVDMNAWLRQNGFLALREGAGSGGDCFQGVDWSRTRAYALGLTGIYLNQKGRESRGIVEQGRESDEIKRELIRLLSGLRDEERGQVAINGVVATASLYKGPYVEMAPDLLVAYNDGYRTSWGAALGRIGPRVFEDNRREWSGDHCIDPQLVPGILFSNRKITAANPGLEDLAPTVLELFGLKTPRYMDGRSLFQSGNGGSLP